MSNKVKNKKLNPRFLKIILSIFILLLVYFLFISGPRGSWQLYKSDREKQQLQEDIQKLELRKAELDSEKNKLENDPGYIEKIAREKYNMKKKGEKVYRIENDKDQ